MSSTGRRTRTRPVAPWAEADLKADKSGVHHAVFWPARNRKFAEAQRLGNRTSEPEYRVGAKYVGDWQNNKKGGFGVQTWTTGQRYEGGWKDGKREGKGTMLVPVEKGRKGALRKQYTGDWAGGKKHGIGVCHYANGDTYEGEWAFGKREGRGKLTCANGDVYEGSWLADQQSGLGVLPDPTTTSTDASPQ